MAEIITLEQQGLCERVGQGIGEAIAEIEAGAMTTLAVPSEGCACDFGLFAIQAHDADLCRAEKQIQISFTIESSTRDAADKAQ
jgi:hypothetical protein